MTVAIFPNFAVLSIGHSPYYVSAFAELLGVELSTLRNWEQGRRMPTGPARQLLRAIERDPENVLKALAAS